MSIIEKTVIIGSVLLVGSVLMIMLVHAILDYKKGKNYARQNGEITPEIKKYAKNKTTFPRFFWLGYNNKK